jgi:hypothetical protein
MDEHAPPDVFRRSGSRLREALDPDLKREFYPGPWDHMRHEMPAIHAFDKAHCLMLGEEGIVARDIVRELLRGLREMEREGMLEARRSVGASHHSGELPSKSVQARPGSPPRRPCASRACWPFSARSGSTRAAREKKRTACATSRVARVTALIELKRGRAPQPGELS